MVCLGKFFKLKDFIYLKTAPISMPGGRVDGRSFSEWTTKCTLKEIKQRNDHPILKTFYSVHNYC